MVVIQEHDMRHCVLGVAINHTTDKTLEGVVCKNVCRWSRIHMLIERRHYPKCSDPYSSGLAGRLALIQIFNNCFSWAHR